MGCCFIELHKDGEPMLVNLNWVEEIRRNNDGTCTIYFGFQSKDAVEQDYIVPDESYNEVRMYASMKRIGINEVTNNG